MRKDGEEKSGEGEGSSSWERVGVAVGKIKNGKLTGVDCIHGEVIK